jgi:hypothetical protein
MVPVSERMPWVSTRKDCRHVNGVASSRQAFTATSAQTDGQTATFEESDRDDGHLATLTYKSFRIIHLKEQFFSGPVGLISHQGAKGCGVTSFKRTLR